MVDDRGTVHCDFDKGRRLGLVPGEDSFYINNIKEERIQVVLCELGEVACVTTMMNAIESLQKMVDSYIEATCPFDDPVAIICNKEANLRCFQLGVQVRQWPDR